MEKEQNKFFKNRKNGRNGSSKNNKTNEMKKADTTIISKYRTLFFPPTKKMYPMLREMDTSNDPRYKRTREDNLKN